MIFLQYRTLRILHNNLYLPKHICLSQRLFTAFKPAILYPALDGCLCTTLGIRFESSCNYRDGVIVFSKRSQWRLVVIT